MARILVIQFRQNPTSRASEQACLTRALANTTELTFVSAVDETSPDWHRPETIMTDIDGVILGGSGDFDFDGGRTDDDPAKQMSYTLLERLRPLFEYIFTHDIPTLGICYGHQLLGAFAGAQVTNDPAQHKSRSHEVRLLVDANDHFLLTDIPTSLFAFYGHKDSLDRVPDGATLIMEGGKACQVTTLRYKNNIYTTQFHPELTYTDMIERIKNSPGYLPEGVSVEDVYRDDSSSNRLLANFGALVVHHAYKLTT